MKTAKSNPRQKKGSVKKEDEKGKNIPSVKEAPGEEEIRKKAAEIYNQRLLIGVSGSDVEDWLEAEALLNETYE
jgi:hypothetical protein